MAPSLVPRTPSRRVEPSRVTALTGSSRVDWLDFPSRELSGRFGDREWKGLEFIDNSEIERAWREFWPHRAGVQNWDAVGRLWHGDDSEWLLVEAKGHVGEIESSCGAKAEGGLETIRRAMDATKQALGIHPDRDWLRPYYQVSNRLAVLHFLKSHNIRARLLLIYFTGDTTAGCDCPKDETAWRGALEAQDAHLGLAPGHALTDRVHKLFLPVFSR
jgi:hypothetical protein